MPAAFDVSAIARQAHKSGTIAVPLVDALIAVVAAAHPAASTFVHWGATSQDVTDSALALCLARALPVLADCLAQLRTAHNVSEAEMAAIVTPPKGSALSFFSTNDYPDEALRKEQSGSVGVLLWVETTGRVSTCTVIESSAADPLKEATCNVFKRRARFEPARDVQKKPIRAPVFARIRWELPAF